MKVKYLFLQLTIQQNFRLLSQGMQYQIKYIKLENKAVPFKEFQMQY